MTNFKKIIHSRALQALGVTLLLLAVFRLGTVVTIPGVSPLYTSFLNSSSLLQLFGIGGGSGLKQYTFFALGIAPFISASIVVQLLGFVEPMKHWKDQGDEGRLKQTNLTRALALLFGGLQAYQAVTTRPQLALSGGGLRLLAPHSTGLTYLALGCTLVIGVFVLSYLSDKITQHGLGNGQSVIITAGILASLSSFRPVFKQLKTQQLGILLGAVVITTLLVVLFNYLTIKLSVVTKYTGKQGDSETVPYLPIKLNPVGMIPIIFAGLIMAVPTLLSAVIKKNHLLTFVTKHVNFSSIEGIAIYGILIVLFSILYVTVQLNPKDMAKRLADNHQQIVGLVPGLETETFLRKTLQKLGVLSGVVIALLAILPLGLALGLKIASTNIGLLGSSSIILVTTLSDLTARFNHLWLEQGFTLGYKKIPKKNSDILPTTPLSTRVVLKSVMQRDVTKHSFMREISSIFISGLLLTGFIVGLDYLLQRGFRYWIQLPRLVSHVGSVQLYPFMTTVVLLIGFVFILLQFGTPVAEPRSIGTMSYGLRGSVKKIYTLLTSFTIVLFVLQLVQMLLWK